MTRWSSTWSDPAWISVDLGVGARISSVKLKWETAAGKAYKIQTSEDNNAWTDRHSTSAGAGGTETIMFAATARFIRLFGTQRTTQWGYSLFEFEVYGTRGTPPPNDTPPAGTETAGTGDINNPAIGPGPSTNVGGTGYKLVKNWNFGADGTITNIKDMSREFQYHDMWNTIGNGTNYGTVTAAPDFANAIAGQPVDSSVRQFTGSSLKTTQKARNGESTVSATAHNAINGSFKAKYKLNTAGSRRGRDILWETRVRYVTPKYLWFALWNAGTKWNNGAELDLVEFRLRQRRRQHQLRRPVLAR